MLLQNGHLRVRSLIEQDKHLLAKWLSDPEVLKYYEGRDNPFDLAKVESVFYACEDDEVKCIIEYEGIPIGYIQYYELDEAAKKEYGYETGRIIGTDQFIGEVEYWNKGIGTLLVTSMTEFLFEHMKADKVVMDPQVWNERAITCYEKCGFKKVKLLSKHEFHEGEFRDCWLIELNKPKGPGILKKTGDYIIATKDIFLIYKSSPSIDSLNELLLECIGNDEFIHNLVLRGVKSKKNVCTIEAYEKNKVVGLITAWESDFHPYCTYFSMITKPCGEDKVETLLIEALSNDRGINFPLQTSIWETSYRLKAFYENHDFVEIRRTYMPNLKSSKIDVNELFADILLPSLSIKDLNNIKDNQMFKFELINLVKENYGRVHSKNPVGEHDLIKWEKLIFNSETILKGSFIAIKDNEIIAYALLHSSEKTNMYEFGWRGTKNNADLRIMLMLTAFQVNFAIENDVDLIQAEIDTTDPCAIEMLKFFPFSPAPTLVTYQKR